MLPKTTYYRQRKLLKAHGINIDLSPNKTVQQTNNVVPMFRVLEAVPAVIAKWAFTKNLIHKSTSNI
jgi:II/X family phage/plasmid replication protein